MANKQLNHPTHKQLRQHKNATTTIVLAVVGVLLVLLSAGALVYLPKAQAQVQSAANSLVPVEVNKPGLDVELTDLQGNPVKFSDYKGQVILYNAWATWCPPCKEEMPVLNAYYNDHKAEGFVVIAVEDGQPIAEVANYVNSTGLDFPVWPDLKWLASETYGITGLPTSFVLDRDFNIRYTWTGAVTRATLEQYVTPLLSE